MMVINMPGIFSNPRPKVSIPIMNAARTTPATLPLPPNILTPPSTTIVMISSSQPMAIFGLVAPSRDVRNTPCQAGHGAIENKQPETVAIDINAGINRRPGIISQGEDISANDCLVQEQAKHQGQNQESDEFIGDQVKQIPLAQHPEIFWVLVIGNRHPEQSRKSRDKETWCR